jgi:N-carbamoyl-L-amino-acid hydrolase
VDRTRPAALEETAMAAAGDNLTIDSARLWDSLMAMAQIGATPKGGVKRLTLTDLDRAARDLFARWCAEAGCTIQVDRMGSMFARRPGADEALPPVLVGSHLDSQPTGGKYDGALGVLAGLELVRTLNDLGIRTRHPIEVVNWTNEEGSRFAPAMVASGVFAGAFDLEFAHGCRDPEGRTLGAELARIGYLGEAPVGGRPVHAYFELHIEQGPILEDAGLEIGVVTGGQGISWYELTLTGVDAHAGPTPMPKRKDALLGAARIVELVNRIGHDHAPSACATVGMVEVRPNSRNVIPGQVFLTVDFRHPEAATLEAMDQALRSEAAAIAARTGLELALAQIFHYPPIPFDPDCVARVRAAAERLGYRHRDIVSGAGHDACYMAKICPTAMVFTPCVGGISHNEIEAIEPAWATAGGQVLLHAVVETAGILA